MPSNIDASPWIKEFNFWLKHTRFQYLESVSIHNLDSKQVKKLIYTSTTPSKLTQIWSHISYKHWKRFWKISLHSTARNIWYRLIHNKIPSPHILHKFIPTSNPSSECPRCGFEDADAIHMIITGHGVWNIWQHIYAQYLYPTIPDLPSPASSTEITNILFNYVLRLKFPHLTPQPLNPLFLQPGQILGATIHTIWIAITQNYKHHIPINLTTTLPRILKTFSRLQKEDDL